MSINFTTCSYHPHRVALAVCECCKRPICIQDRRILMKGYHLDKYNNYNHNYCKICYGSIVDMRIDPLIYFVILGSTYLFLFIMLQDINFRFAISGIFIPLLVFVFLYDVTSSEKISITKNEASQLKNQVFEKADTKTIPNFANSKNDVKKGLKKFLLPYEQSKENLPSITCFECGSRFYINNMFCDSCGYESQDELIEKYSILFI